MKCYGNVKLFSFAFLINLILTYDLVYPSCKFYISALEKGIKRKDIEIMILLCNPHKRHKI